MFLKKPCLGKRKNRVAAALSSRCSRRFRLIPLTETIGLSFILFYISGTAVPTEVFLHYGFATAGILVLGCFLFSVVSVASLAAVHHLRARVIINIYIYIRQWLCKHHGAVPFRPVLAYGSLPFLGLLAAFGCLMIFGTTPECCLWLAFLAILTGTALVDIKIMEIPDFFPAAALLLGIAAIWICPEESLLSRFIGLAAVSLPMLGIALLVEGGFGGGDIKLMAGCGFLLGWRCTLLSALLGILGGGVYGIFLLALRRKKGNEHFAFGPFLAAGMAACALWGPQLTDLYLRLFDLSRFF